MADFRFRVRGENDRVPRLQGEHRVAHGRDDGVGDRADRRDHAHGLGHEDQAGVLILADDAARLLAFEVVPDHAGLALRLGDFVLVGPEARLVMGRRRDALGIVVDVLAEIPNDGVHLLLREVLECGLGLASPGDEFLDLAGLG